MQLYNIQGLVPYGKQNRLRQCNYRHLWAVVLSYNMIFASTGKLYYHNSYSIHKYSIIEFNFYRSPRENGFEADEEYQRGLLLETGEWTKGMNASDLWRLVNSCCDPATVQDFSDPNVLLCVTGLVFC